MMGRDNREARFHYAPNPKRIKQLATIVVPVIGSRTAGKSTTATAAEQHSRNVSQGTAQGRDNAHTSNAMATSLDDVLMPKDNTVIPEDGVMDEIDRELEEFKRFCLMIKPLKNRQKVAVQVNLKDLACIR